MQSSFTKTNLLPSHHSLLQRVLGKMLRAAVRQLDVIIVLLGPAYIYVGSYYFILVDRGPTERHIESLSPLHSMQVVKEL